MRYEAAFTPKGKHGSGSDPTPDRDPESQPETAHAPAVFAIDDANLGFRNHARPRSMFQKGRPRWIVLRTVAPLARNDLWQDLIRDDLAGGSADGLREDLICVVSADDLRQEQQSSISRGLSWERTLSDLHGVLAQDPILASLARCRFLVVCFSADAARVIDRPPDRQRTATLVFDPVGIEGDWASEREGEVPGQLTCMAAAVTLWATAAAAAEQDAMSEGPASLARYVEAGLHAVRDLVDEGHGTVTPGVTPDGFPFERLATLLTKKQQTAKDGSRGSPGGTLARVVLPWPGRERFAPGWSLLLSSQTPPEQEEPPSVLGLARLLVTHGPDLALAEQPRAVFGNLTALDWREIESLRGIRRLMARFAADPKPERPLCLGIFGPPGAGKSFGVKEIAKKILGERGWISCNLSQIRDASDLTGPFHQARDLVLSGITPVIFLDEFDSKELRWLQHLIAPMQDGVFQDGQRSHAVGKVVLVFAGGTSPSFRLFSEGRSVDSDKTFKARKGPDFVSRLDATLDVMGPNPREDGEDDRTYPLRRAQLLRHFLAPPSTGTLDIDVDLLTALLLAPRYRHGSRSLEKLAKALKGGPGEPIRCSALSRVEQDVLTAAWTTLRKILEHVTGGDLTSPTDVPVDKTVKGIGKATDNVRTRDALHRVALAYAAALKGIPDALVSLSLCAKLNALHRGWMDWKETWHALPTPRLLGGPYTPPSTGHGWSLYEWHPVALRQHPASRPDYRRKPAPKGDRFFAGGPSQMFETLFGALRKARDDKASALNRDHRTAGRRLFLFLGTRGVGKGHFFEALRAPKRLEEFLSASWPGGETPRYDAVLMINLSFSTEVMSAFDRLCNVLDFCAKRVFAGKPEAANSIHKASSSLSRDRIGRLIRVLELYDEFHREASGRVLVAINAFHVLFNQGGQPKNGQAARLLEALLSHRSARAPIDLLLVCSGRGFPKMFRQTNEDDPESFCAVDPIALEHLVRPGISERGRRTLAATVAEHGVLIDSGPTVSGRQRRKVAFRFDEFAEKPAAFFHVLRLARVRVDISQLSTTLRADSIQKDLDDIERYAEVMGMPRLVCEVAFARATFLLAIGETRHATTLASRCLQVATMCDLKLRQVSGLALLARIYEKRGHAVAAGALFTLAQTFANLCDYRSAAFMISDHRGVVT